MRPIVHDIRSHLAIAVANIEAIADGKLEATPKRLEAILEACGRSMHWSAASTWRSVRPTLIWDDFQERLGGY
jgi:hypothetical protein